MDTGVHSVRVDVNLTALYLLVDRVIHRPCFKEVNYINTFSNSIGHESDFFMFFESEQRLEKLSF